MMGIGEVAALSAAFFWTCSSLLWSRIHLSALTLNLFKNWIAVLLALIPILSAFLINGESAQVAPLQSWIWLGLGGFIGIVAGDTFFFRSLQIIGPRLALMVAILAPLFSVLFSGLMLREYLGLISLSGVLLTILGVFLVISERNVQSESPGLRPGRFRHGIGYLVGNLVQSSRVSKIECGDRPNFVGDLSAVRDLGPLGQSRKEGNPDQYRLDRDCTRRHL